MLNKKEFGVRLRLARKTVNESQDTLAKLLGVTPTQISDLENGKTGTNLDRFLLLCEHYRVSADYLLGITDDPTWRGNA
ncbi:MAG: helix-turn-helix transcriptional regulator [Oscillospiraceae bacterium]|nr:helix-turn-helix transcriptional regulator [Oscillospiraceae bacterium]